MKGAERVNAIELLGQGRIWVDADGAEREIATMDLRHVQNVRNYLMRNGSELAEQAYARVAFGPQPSGDMACDAVDSMLSELEDAAQNPEPWLARSPLFQALDARLAPPHVEVTYVDQVRNRLAEELPGLAESRHQGLLDLYTVLILAVGENVTSEQVHDAWSVDASRTRPGHPSIVPFSELSERTQDLDLKYAEAIRKVARELGLWSWG